MHNLRVKVLEFTHKYLKIIYVDEMAKMAYFDISKTSNVKMGCFWDNGYMMDIFFITALEIEPDVLITQFAAQTLSENMIQFEFMSAAPSTAFKKRNLVFTFPELSLPAVTFHWYDMSPWGQIYYVTGADAGAPELWNWITGNPGEIIGFNVKVVSI